MTDDKKNIGPEVEKTETAPAPEQPVPGKGNFFLEELAKTGAGEKYQLFGQIGLDHGPEWYHGRFTGIDVGGGGK